MPEIEMKVWKLGQDEDHHCLVFLHDGEDRFLPVRIGPCEFYSIWLAIYPKPAPEGVPRPQTHDLIGSLIEDMGARLTKVVIDDLWDDIFFAKLHLSRNGETLTVDTRPSDGIAVALRLKAPLFCEQTVLAAAADSTSTNRDNLDDLLDASGPEGE